MNYEEEVLEQEKRTFFNKPLRYTTLLSWPRKFTYEEFVEEIRCMGVAENYTLGEKFIEEWIELLMAYQEIEQEDYIPTQQEKCCKNIIIDMYLQEAK